MDRIRTPHGVVMTYSPPGSGCARTHETVAQTVISRALAALKGYDFAGEYDSSRRYPGRVYLVPSDTLVKGPAMQTLGIETEDDLFGGLVPHPFVATKAITHPLVEPDADAPDGWSHAFTQRVRDVVLPGFTVFTPGDARRASKRLLNDGPVRLKPARGIGWRGQAVVASPDEFESAFPAFDTADLRSHGLVLEMNLTDLIPYSIGQVCVGGMLATYHGIQRAATDNRGATVYGGSDLIIVRGGYDALLGLALAPEVRLVVQQARAYDAATEEFAGMLASRRNYDVARGRDAQGRWRSGVLEQSWRIGGASGAEVAALGAFQARPGLSAVRAWCIEDYGITEAPPPCAIEHFCGIDDHVGPIAKYTFVEPHDIAR